MLLCGGLESEWSGLSGNTVRTVRHLVFDGGTDSLKAQQSFFKNYSALKCLLLLFYFNWFHFILILLIYSNFIYLFYFILFYNFFDEAENK